MVLIGDLQFDEVGSRSEPRYAVPEELGPENQQDDEHDHVVVIGHELLDRGEWTGGDLGRDEVEEDRTGDGDRADDDEHRDRHCGAAP